MTLRRIVALCCVALLAASCDSGGGAGAGSGDPPPDALAEAAASLRGLRSGTVDFTLETQLTSGDTSGFYLRGPVSLRHDGSALPVADVVYGALGAKGAGVGIVLTGEAAYAVFAEQAYEMPRDSAERVYASFDTTGGPFLDFELDEWVEDPEVSEGPAGTLRIVGDVDPVTALNDLFDFAGKVEVMSLPPLDGAEARRLEEAVDSATIEIVAGDDGAFRGLTLEIDLGDDVPPSLQDELGGFLGERLTLDFGVDDANEPVEVAAPADPLPMKALLEGS